MTNSVHSVSIVLGDTPPVKLIKKNEITSSRVKLNFIEYPTIHKAFAPMVRNLAFDVCEIAAVTFFQALEAGKPLRLLPVVLAGRMHHGSLFYYPKNGTLTPRDLKGRKIGVRAYSQTTGMWVRGILREQYGISSDEIIWVTTEEAHVAEYKNPPNVEIHEGADLVEMLLSSEISAVITSPKSVKDKGLSCVIPGVDSAAAEWYEKHKTVMINHMVAVTEELFQKDPHAVQEIYDLLRKGIDMTSLDRSGGAMSAVGYGIDNIWNGGALQKAMQYSLEQKLISRVFDKNEIFADVFDN